MTARYGDTLFTKEQIAEAIENLNGREAYQDVASLELKDETPPEVLTAFASLAKALKLNVSIKYDALYIRRRKPDTELRDMAVERLQRQCEAGQIEAMAA